MSVKKEARIKLSDEVKFVIERLSESGFSAYAVGGAVRDSVLGLSPSDWDVTTSALPNQTEEVFSDKRVVETGIKHGTVTVIVNDKPIEITTFRKESGYSDNRHPDKIEFVGDVAEDLRRRDFTVNSLAYNEKDGLIDLYGGLSDINDKIIRAVGNAEERFSEDSLRIIRAVRFASKLGFKIEENTLRAAEKLKSGLDNVSAERIFSEFVKTLCGKDAFNALTNYREIICEVVPEIRDCFDFEQHSKWHLYDVYEHICRSVAAVKNEPQFRTVMFFHDIAKPAAFFVKNGEGHFYGHAKLSAQIADRVLQRLKAPNSFRKNVVFLVENHDLPLPESDFKLKKILNKTGAEDFFDLIEVKYADNAAQGTEIAIEERAKIDKARAMAERIVKSGECFSLNSLAISGEDLKALGFSGKAVGSELERLLLLCMETPSLNEPSELKRLAEKRIEKNSEKNFEKSSKKNFEKRP